MMQINIRLDDAVKQQAEELLAAMGLTMSAAITIFLRQVIAERAIPFRISADPDPVYNPANMARLLQSVERFKEGRVKGE